MSQEPVLQFIERYWARKKRVNPRYSLRAFARDIGCTPGFASRLLSGKKSLSVSLARRIRKPLGLDRFASQELESLLVSKALQKKGLVRAARQETSRGIKAIQKYVPVEPKFNAVLTHWYDLAVADLSLCKEFDPHPSAIASRLGIKEQEASQALARLVALGLLKKTATGYSKTQERIRFPASVPKSEIREFHRQMIRKATDHMMSRTLQSDYERRMITGITFAMNTGHLKWARERLQEVLHEIAEKVTDSDATEVYQLNLQFFPLSGPLSSVAPEGNAIQPKP